MVLQVVTENSRNTRLLFLAFDDVANGHVHLVSFLTQGHGIDGFGSSTFGFSLD